MHVFAFNPKGAFTAQCSKWSVFFFELTIHRVILRTPEALLCFAKWGKNQISLKKRNYYPLTGTLKVSVCSQGMCWCFRSYLYMPEYVLRWWETLCSASHVPSKPRTKEEGEDKNTRPAAAGFAVSAVGDLAI